MRYAMGIDLPILHSYRTDRWYQSSPSPTDGKEKPAEIYKHLQKTLEDEEKFMQWYDLQRFGTHPQLRSLVLSAQLREELMTQAWQQHKRHATVKK